MIRLLCRFIELLIILAALTCGLMFISGMARAQAVNEVNVFAMPGTELGAKFTNAMQFGCALNPTIPCVLNAKGLGGVWPWTTPVLFSSATGGIPLGIMIPPSAQWTATAGMTIAGGAPGANFFIDCGATSGGNYEFDQRGSPQITYTALSGALISFTNGLGTKLSNCNFTGVRVGSTSQGLVATGTVGAGTSSLDIINTTFYNFGGNCVEFDDVVFGVTGINFNTVGCGGIGKLGTESGTTTSTTGQFDCFKCTSSGNYGAYQDEFHSPASGGFEAHYFGGTISDTPNTVATGGGIGFLGTTGISVLVDGVHFESLGGTAAGTEPDCGNAAICINTTNGLYNIRNNNFVTTSANCLGGVGRNAIAMKSTSTTIVNLSGNTYANYAKGGPWGTNCVAFDSTGSTGFANIQENTGNGASDFVFANNLTRFYVNTNTAGLVTSGPIQVPNGTAAAPSLGIGSATSGFYANAANNITWASGSTNQMTFLGGGLNASSANGYSFSSAANSTTAGDTFLCRSAAGIVRVGTACANNSGSLTAKLFSADGGTVCSNGELALSAGWGTTPTVTTVVGTGQTCEWTITSAGTGQAANPTITDTLTNALPAATTVCEMRMVGGTGTSTLIDQTTLSATAPVFTFNGTPVAASTYKVVRRCGP